MTLAAPRPAAKPRLPLAAIGANPFARIEEFARQLAAPLVTPRDGADAARDTTERADG